MPQQNTANQSEGFQQVELFGIPALFSHGRIEDSRVPEGLYRYDLRGFDDDPGRPATLEKNVVVNHAGSILSPVRIPYLNHGEHLNLGSGLSFADSREKSAEEFQQLWGTLQNYPKTGEILHSNIIRENEKLIWAGHGGPLAEHENVYAVYQINRAEVPYEFMGTDFIGKRELSVKAIDYNLVYGGLLKDEMDLDTLYSRFNTDPPEGFFGRSMSVSDVVILNRGDTCQAWFVDNIGFTPLPDFVQERAELAEAKELINDFMFREYEGTAEPDYSDPAHVDIALTTTEDEKYEVQVSVDLAECRMEKKLNGEEVSRNSCRDMRELIDTKLKYLDFTSLTSVSERERNRYERRQDLTCKKSIETAIDNGYDHTTSHLDRNCGFSVVDEFGPERVEHVLAVTVCQKEQDGRFSPETKEWARDVLQLQSDEEISEAVKRSECAVNSHPALLEGFIGFTRQYMDEIRSPSEMKYYDEIEGLASDLDKFALAYDTYEYLDTVENSEENVNRISDQIRSGETAGITDWLKRVSAEPGDELDVKIAGMLLKRLDDVKEGLEFQVKEAEMSL